MDIHKTPQGVNKPQIEYSPPFDIVELPSQGYFYPKVDGKRVKTAKVYDLTTQDDELFFSENLIENNMLIDTLLEAKVECDVPLGDMLIGDRVALIVYLRTKMDHIYRFQLKDPQTGKMFEHEFDLTTLKIKDFTPPQDEENGLYEFHLPKSNKKVKFTLLTQKLKDEIDLEVQRTLKNKPRLQKRNLSRTKKILRLVKSVEGIENPFDKEAFLKNMHIMDGRKLHKYIEEVEPNIDLNVEIQAPSGSRFRTNIPFTAEFLYASE